MVCARDLWSEYVLKSVWNSTDYLVSINEAIVLISRTYSVAAARAVVGCWLRCIPIKQRCLCDVR
jgi:predicted oxidoreductase